MAVLFIGVAASTAFNDARDVRLSPGQTATVGDYDFEYVRPTSRISTTSDGRLEKISFGAVVRVRRDGRLITTLRPDRGYFPSRDLAGLGPVGRFFEGEATSEIGLKAGMRGDLWAAMTPDKEVLGAAIEEGDRAFAAAAGKLAPAVEAQLLGQALRGLADTYVRDGAGRDLPPHHVAARDVDLARRDHRLPRRAIAMWPGDRDAMRRLGRARYAARAGAGSRRRAARRTRRPPPARRSNGGRRAKAAAGARDAPG